MSSGLRADSITPVTPNWKLEAPTTELQSLPRPRITAKMERHVGKDRSRGDVLLVSAPAGYGKTIALAQWARATDVPVMWYHLDASDNDPRAFIYGVVRALRTRLPRGHWQVKTLLGRLHDDTLSPLDTQRAGVLLIEDIQRHVSRPMALVITGIAEIDRRSAVASLLDQLLLRPPDQLRMLLECREAPDLRLSPLLAQQRLEGIGMDDLRLTEEELAGLLCLKGVEQDSEDLRDLQELCDGWVTGALLATGALWRTCLGAHMGGLLDREAVFSYLASEVIDRLPAELREFAMRVSVLNYLTAPLCQELVPERDSRRLLAELARTTGFLSAAGRRDREQVYQFQPLLRQALLSRLEATLGDVSELSRYQSRAGCVLEEMGDAEEAAQQYAASADHSALLNLIERQRGDLQRSGYGATLARWIDLLPLAVRREHADLDVLLAELHRLAGRTAEALAIVNNICQRTAVNDRPEVAATRARALIVRADVLYSRGDYCGAQRDCLEALRLASTTHDELHIKARFLMTASVSAVDGPKAARAWLETVEERCSHLGDLWALGRLKYVRSNLAIAEGAFAEAEREAASGLLYAQEANDETRAIMCLLNLGAVRQFLGQPVLARENLESALSLAKSSGHLQAQGYALANLGDLECTIGDHAGALNWYEQALDVEKRVDDQHLRACAVAGMAFSLAMSGGLNVARFRVERALATLPPDQRGQDRAILTTALGFVCYRQGAFADAAAALCEVIAFSAERSLTAEEARAQVTLAAVRRAQGDVAASHAALTAALSLSAQADGTPMSLLDVRYMPELWPLLRASEHPLALDLLNTINPASSNSTEVVLPSIPETAKELRVYAFGETRVSLGGDVVTSWARPVMREALVYLLDRETPARRDEILADLWPDKDPHLANEEFRKVRSELKKALGVLIVRQGDDRFAIETKCWFDVAEFKRLVADAHEAARAGNRDESLASLREAVALGSGYYLNDSYAEWSTLRRDALRREYLQALEQLVDAEMESKNFKLLTRSAYLLLDADPFCEKAHRALMVGFCASGEPARALEQYRRCADILQREFQTAPSAQTAALYRTILERMGGQQRQAARAVARAR